jgi:predicted peptidase
MKQDLPLERKMFADALGKKLPYRLLTPLRYDHGERYPLVLFLHGAGERGNDNVAQLLHGVPEFVAPAKRKKYPCFLLAPQCPRHERWADWSARRQPEMPTEPLRLALAALEQMQKEYSVDADRIYVTGLSMGGFGTWDLVSRYPERFAAAVPICGGGDPAMASRLTQLPIWAFHGRRDLVVPARCSRTMIEALKQAGGQPRYTEFPRVGHASWVPAYKDSELFGWLFAQKRRSV